MVEDLFRSFKNVEGRLMLATRDSQGNAHYHIWFDYTRSLVNQIREGDLVAVQNFSPTLVQSYLDAASEVSRLAVGDIDATPTSVSYDVAQFMSQTGHVSDAPIGTRVPHRHAA